ncbi:MAG: hypothetical protein GXP31_10180 [Kiritimatiellaeota bacterium]|nr:hypothetical protein [Kiritimatiellota bacterium]
MKDGVAHKSFNERCFGLRVRRRRFMAACGFLALATAVASGGRPAAAPSSLRDWLLCGAFPGMGGLGGNGHRLEAHLRPSPGDTERLNALDKRFVATWKEYRSPGDWVSLDEEGTFKDRPDFAWPRGCAYAAVYLSAPHETNAEIAVEVSCGRAVVWWGSARLRTPVSVTLRPEWERLLIKFVHPRVNEPGFLKPWRYRVRLRTPRGDPVQGLRYCLDDPLCRPPPGVPPPLAVLSKDLSLKVRPGRPAFTFLPDELLRCTLVFNAGAPSDASMSVDWRLADFEDNTVAHGTTPLRFANAPVARVALAPGSRPVGFYNLWIEVRKGRWVIRRFGPFGFAVVRGPAVPGPTPRKLSSSFYWLRPDDGYLEWLHRIGMVRNVGVSATWWTKTPESPEYKPGIDAIIARARKLGVELVGYLDGGWPAAMNPKLKLKPDQLFVWFWQPLPVCGTPEYERVVRRYVRRTVRRYRDTIHVWKTYNEIDRTPMPAARYAYIARLIAAEVRIADPRARIVGASFTKPPEAYWKKVVAAGGSTGHDAIDLHCYPLGPPTFAAPCNLSGWKVHGAAYNAVITETGGKPRPIWWGEVGARRSLCADAAAGQADFFLKMNAVGFADPGVEVIAWCDPMAEHADDFTLMHKGSGASPAVCAANVAAHFMDGRKARILRRDSVQAAVLSGPQDQLLAVWTFQPQTLTLDVKGGRAERIDLVGRTTPLKVTDGTCEIRAERRIQLIRAREISIR